MKTRTHQMTVLAMLATLAYALVFFVRIPIVPDMAFLEYEPKTVLIAIAGFLFGPLSALILSILVPALEMITFSVTGPIGFLMNVIATAFFACVAALIYKFKRTLVGAAIGLAVGCLSAAGVMLLWNYLITPLYQGVPRDIIAGMLVPVFLPFNLLKGGLNAGFAMLLYKPVREALSRSHLLPASGGIVKRGVSIVTAIASLLLAASCILLILAWNGII